MKMQSVFVNKYFLFMAGSVLRVKGVTSGCKGFADEEVETEVRKWSGQQFRRTGKMMGQMNQC
jgi:hypothetical protein